MLYFLNMLYNVVQAVYVKHTARTVFVVFVFSI